MASFVLRPPTVADAERIARWRYTGPWAVYDQRPQDGPITAAEGYLVVVHEPGDVLIGFCCIGPDARVPGILAEPGVVDIGVGMNPAFVGRGYGREFVGALVAHVQRPPAPECIRAVIQAWNARSRSLLHSLGFVETRRHISFQGGRDVEYVVVELRP